MFFTAIANSPFVHFLHTMPWLPQVLETVHMTFHSLLVGAAVLLALRLLGFGKAIPLARLVRYLLPACWTSLGFLAVSGGLMFAMSADRYVNDYWFLWKLAAVAEGVLVLAVIHVMLRRNAARWDEQGVAPVPIRVIAGASISIWFAAITFGRFTYTAL
jgi:hypothetical protein